MLKVGSAVHTAHGPGSVTDTDTVRGRTQYKVAGQGFSVWLDETKIAALGDVDESNSTTLPYDYEPQHPVEMYNQEQSMSPDHSVDADELLTPTNSVTGESEEGMEYPGPASHLFATSSYHYADADASLGDGGAGVLDMGPTEQSYGLVAPAGAGIQGILHQTGQSVGDMIENSDFTPDFSMTGQEPPAPFNPGPKVGSIHTAAPGSMRHYMQWAQQAGMQPDQAEAASLYGSSHGLDEGGVGKLLDHFNNQGERTAAGAWGDVDVEGGEGGGSGSRPGSFDHYIQYANQNGMHPGDSLTAGRYSREHGVPNQTSSGYAMQVGNGRQKGDGLRPAPTGDQMHPNGHFSASHRPAGLSDKYIDIQAAVDPTDPVTQFRNDPVSYIERTAYLVESSTGLDPRVGQYMDLVEADPMIRQAAWNDVRDKAMRLRREGAVEVLDVQPAQIYANVTGDNGTYSVMIHKGSGSKITGGHDIANWFCGCDWGKWAFKRKKTFVGRLCSHGYAAYMEMQSAHMTGKPRQQKQPKRQKPKRDMSQFDNSFGYYHGSKESDMTGAEALEYIKNNPDQRHKADQAYLCRCPECAPKLEAWEAGAEDRRRNAPEREERGEVPQYADADEYRQALGLERVGHRRESSALSEFKKWAEEENGGTVDVPSADAYISELEEPLTPSEAQEIHNYAYDNMTERPEREYDVDGYTFDPDEVYKGGNGEDSSALRSQSRPSRLSPDLYAVPEGEGQTWTNLDDDRKTTGPDQITARRTASFEEALARYKATGASKADDDALMAGFCHHTLPQVAGAVSPKLVWEGAKASGLTAQDLLHLAQDSRAIDDLQWVERTAKVEKNWAKKQNNLDDEASPIVRFSMRKEALTYTADEGLLERLRDLSAESPSENFGNMAERNKEVAEVIGELRDRGYDASLFVAVVKTADDNFMGTSGTVADDDENESSGLWSPAKRTEQTTGPANGEYNSTDFYTNGQFDNSGGLGLADAVTGGGVLGLGEQYIDNNNAPSEATPVKSTAPAPGNAPSPGNSPDSPGTDGGGSSWSENNNTDPIGPGEYTIQSGDTYSNLAERAGWGDNYEGFADATGYQSDSPDDIFAGDKMNVVAPPGAVNPADPMAPAAPEAGAPDPAPAPGPAPAADNLANAAPDPGVGGGLGFIDPPAANPAAPAPLVGDALTNPGLTAARRFYADEDEESLLGGSGGADKGVGGGPAAAAAAEDAPAPTPAPAPAPAPAATPASQAVTEPAPAASPAAPKEPVQEPSDGSKKVLEDEQPQNATSTSNPMGDFANIMPILEGVGSAVLPLVTNTLGPVASGIGNAIGSGISGLFTAGVVTDGDDMALGDDDAGEYDNALTVDPAFAGSGPSRKDWYSTSEDWISDHEYLDLNDEPEGDLISYRKQPKQAGYDDGSDIVRQFQANIGNTALGSNAGGGGSYSDDAIAQAAQGFLRTAGRVYSLAEQQELMDEEHPKGARNLPGLDLRGTHYLEGA